MMKFTDTLKFGDNSLSKWQLNDLNLLNIDLFFFVSEWSAKILNLWPESKIVDIKISVLVT
jgi:hypothetical protein